MENKYQFFLQDIFTHIKDKSDQSKNLKKKDEFDLGYNMAMYEVMSLIHQQAEVSSIYLKNLILENIEPERYFLIRINSQ